MGSGSSESLSDVLGQMADGAPPEPTIDADIQPPALPEAEVRPPAPQPTPEPQANPPAAQSPAAPESAPAPEFADPDATMQLEDVGGFQIEDEPVIAEEVSDEVPGVQANQAYQPNEPANPDDVYAAQVDEGSAEANAEAPVYGEIDDSQPAYEEAGYEQASYDAGYEEGGYQEGGYQEGGYEVDGFVAQVDEPAVDNGPAFELPAGAPAPSAKKFTATTKRKKGNMTEMKAFAVPVCFTLGLLLMAPGIWAVMTLTKTKEPDADDAESTTLLAYAMLASWPVSLCLLFVAVLFIFQVAKEKKSQKRLRDARENR